jgi:hypothetical protein
MSQVRKMKYVHDRPTNLERIDSKWIPGKVQCPLCVVDAACRLLFLCFLCLQTLTQIPCRSRGLTVGNSDSTLECPAVMEWVNEKSPPITAKHILLVEQTPPSLNTSKLFVLERNYQYKEPRRQDTEHKPSNLHPRTLEITSKWAPIGKRGKGGNMTHLKEEIARTVIVGLTDERVQEFLIVGHQIPNQP